MFFKHPENLFPYGKNVKNEFSTVTNIILQHIFLIPYHQDK